VRPAAKIQAKEVKENPPEPPQPKRPYRRLASINPELREEMHRLQRRHYMRSYRSKSPAGSIPPPS